ncbi:hypothetical protein [Youxingia wuxianensis]|uniref:Uncharacterized protein n=1 Tax=Youxingia wuxianensis TaxID=2763678 RepID=A0A926IIW3_9FIRM|nr:hypothetical protein [Youxingia wuxianensis]MBC8586620.1 hypothetical protein [Youxingia wuxianensis]
MKKKKNESPKVVSILEVDNIDDYPEDTIFVLDETEGMIRRPEVLQMEKENND